MTRRCVQETFWKADLCHKYQNNSNKKVLLRNRKTYTAQGVASLTHLSGEGYPLFCPAQGVASLTHLSGEGYPLFCPGGGPCPGWHTPPPPIRQDLEQDERTWDQRLGHPLQERTWDQRPGKEPGTQMLYCTSPQPVNRYLWKQPPVVLRKRPVIMLLTSCKSLESNTNTITFVTQRLFRIKFVR